MIPSKLPDWQIHWIDRHVEPHEPPNPKYPNGVDVDISKRDAPACSALLTHPAKRCGYWIVHCKACGATAVVTTAGRRDDPRSLRMACKSDDV